MLHTNFQGHRPFGSRDHDFVGFYHIWAWRPSWSYDLNHLIKLSFSNPMEAPHKILISTGQVVSKKKKFENVESG